MPSLAFLKMLNIDVIESLIQGCGTAIPEVYDSITKPTPEIRLVSQVKTTAFEGVNQFTIREPMLLAEMLGIMFFI